MRFFDWLFPKLEERDPQIDVYLHRIREDRTATLGLLVLESDVPLCVTLEKPDLDNSRRVSNIPEGNYEVVARYSDKFKHHWHVKGVPNRDLILIHKGNTTKDTQGCILVGMDYGKFIGNKPSLLRSKAAFEKLHRILPDKFTLHITNMKDTDVVTGV